MSARSERRLTDKVGEYLERMRSRAVDRLEDVTFVDDLVDRVQTRVARHRTLRTDLDPLTRLSRSYARGSWRDCPPSEVALALAAVMYVQSPLDAVPDWLPGGLNDDEAVVKWVSARISGTLERYAEWEAAFGEAEVAVVLDDEPRPYSLEVQVLDDPSPSLFHRVDGARKSQVVPSFAGAPALLGGVEVLKALQSGGVVRVLGPQHLLAGLDRGTLEMVPSAGGLLGTVRDTTSKQFAGNLRLGDLEGANPMAPALAGFQLASALTLQYYLARIDGQLNRILEEVLGGRQDLRDERYGRIEAARRRCATAERVLLETGNLGQQDRNRLNHAENDLEQTYGALRASVEAFCEEVEQLDLEACQKGDLGSMLENAVKTPLADAQLLLFAVVIRHRMNGLDAHLLSADGEERMAIATEELAHEHREMEELLLRVRAAFAKLSVPKRHLDERWGVLGGPEKQMGQFAASSASLRSVLSERGLLPAYIPDAPFVADLRMGNGDAIETEWAWLKVTA